FGGGTPSLLSKPELDKVFEMLHKNYRIPADAEITFETNPDDVNSGVLSEWRSLGINRLSLGVQSFYEEDLQWMNRAHTSGQALRSIAQVQDAGFDNLTIDLIYGSPGLTDSKWQHNVTEALELKIPHLSCYALTVEPQTALDKMIASKKSPPVHTEDQARQFLLLMDWLSDAGYEHYEISNFALPGMHSRHNSAYWAGVPYLGLGPSAHSYNGVTRQWNVANNPKYITALKNDQVPFEIEELSEDNRHNEFVMINLRTAKGISRSEFVKQFGVKAEKEMSFELQQFIDSGKVEMADDRFVLTREGKLFADGISAALFR
ncbi:MAG: radical SAM family heme chaperone HemW, partial [Flavitalea sp.]